MLKEFLKYIGKEEEAEKIINLTSYLEFGACSVPALEFMALGLPREAAIRLSQFFNDKPAEDTGVYLECLRKLNVETLNISNYLRNQIKNVQDIL